MTEINISTMLTELRKAKGATQEEVAEALQISNKTISKWENGTSTPDLEMLVALSRYYNVSTDTLLGLKTEKNSTTAVLANQFKNLDKRQTILKTFEISREIFPAYFNNFRPEDIETYDDMPIIPPKSSRGDICRISHEAFYNYNVCSENVNLSVMQLRNSANFKWLLDPECQTRIIYLLSFLADADTLKVIHFIHSTACSKTFTVDYLKNNTSVDAKKVETILEKCVELEMGVKREAHLKDRDVYIYDVFGDGLILALISIAYQKMHSNNRYNYSYHDYSKMIRGEN